MFKVLRLKTVIICVLIALSCVLLSVGILSANSKQVPKPTYTIVIDAGHGGLDVK